MKITRALPFFKLSSSSALSLSKKLGCIFGRRCTLKDEVVILGGDVVLLDGTTTLVRNLPLFLFDSVGATASGRKGCWRSFGSGVVVVIELLKK